MDKEILKIHELIGINEEHLGRNRLLFYDQPSLTELEIIEFDFEGKPFILISAAARAWRSMKQAAAADGIELLPFSGFRSYGYQSYLITHHLKKGRALSDILTQIAIPGFSEHHSGRAVDIHEPGRPTLEEEFEKTPAFRWLTANAQKFGFSLSYPRNNERGIVYEPWHWFYTA